MASAIKNLGLLTLAYAPCTLLFKEDIMPRGYNSDRHLTLYLEEWQKSFLTKQAKENNRSISQQVTWFLKDVFKEAQDEEKETRIIRRKRKNNK